MKRIVLILTFILSASVAHAQDSLRLITYNLRFGELASMNDIGKALAQINPDIVFLQECDWGTYRKRAPKQNGVKFINVLANETGLFGLYGKSINYMGGYYGIGILSRYPIISSQRILLPNDGKTEQRSALVAEVELPSGKIIALVCTHLEVKSSDMRIAQVKYLNKILKSYDTIIMGGDMNAEPESEEMRILRKTWKDLTNSEFTFSTSEPSMKIDYIYARPVSKVNLISTSIVKNVILSDHFAVKSDIILY